MTHKSRFASYPIFKTLNWKEDLLSVSNFSCILSFFCVSIALKFNGTKANLSNTIIRIWKNIKHIVCNIYIHIAQLYQLLRSFSYFFLLKWTYKLCYAYTHKLYYEEFPLALLQFCWWYHYYKDSYRVASNHPIESSANIGYDFKSWF